LKTLQRIADQYNINISGFTKNLLIAWLRAEEDKFPS
jgi:hypothetical protein